MPVPMFGKNYCAAGLPLPCSRRQRKTSPSTRYDSSNFYLAFPSFNQRGLCKKHCEGVRHCHLRPYLAFGEMEYVATCYLWQLGICGRIHKTIPQEFYQAPLHCKICDTLENCRGICNEWQQYYNNDSPCRGGNCCSRRPGEGRLNGEKVWKKKLVRRALPEGTPLKNDND